LVAGAGCVLNVEAAAGQLSFTPGVNFAVDDDSNRNLVPGGPASQSETLELSASLKGTTEASDFTVSPLVRYQYFDSSAFADIFERDVSLTEIWTLERGKVTLTGEDGDNSTLTTEATETGILSSRLHQRSDQGGLSYAYDQTERLSLITTGSYLDTSYYGTPGSYLLNLLQGYRYPSASVAEQYQISEISTISATVTYSKVLSQLSILDSQDIGATLEYRRSFSDTLDLDATIGESEAQSQSTANVNTGSLSLTRRFESGSVVLSYVRSLTPLGTGVLVQRQVYSLSASRSLSDQLTATLTFSRVQNGQTDVQPHVGEQLLVQNYNSGQLSFAWQFAEYWHLSADLDTTRTQVLSPVNYTVQEWRVGMSLTWSPQPLSTQF
jgi:hypothetical protein